MKFPQTHSQVRAWMDRLGLSYSQAGGMLGIANFRTMARRDVTRTTSYHMDLLEAVFNAAVALREGRLNDAKAMLEATLDARMERQARIQCLTGAQGDGPDGQIEVIETGDVCTAGRNSKGESQ